VVGVSCAIVVLLFGVNPFGSAKIGACYAPIVLLWFLFNIITAIYNIHNFYPGVFKAFSPYYGQPLILPRIILQTLLQLG
jgi:KUP system potassium uptake protein